MIKESLINKLISMFKTESIKSEIKNICIPILNILLKELYPYIYFSFFFHYCKFFIKFSNIFLSCA